MHAFLSACKFCCDLLVGLPPSFSHCRVKQEVVLATSHLLDIYPHSFLQHDHVFHERETDYFLVNMEMLTDVHTIGPGHFSPSSAASLENQIKPFCSIVSPTRRRTCWWCNTSNATEGNCLVLKTTLGPGYEANAQCICNMHMINGHHAAHLLLITTDFIILEFKLYTERKIIQLELSKAHTLSTLHDMGFAIEEH